LIQLQASICEGVDAGDHAIQHRLDAGDQPVGSLESKVADGGGQTAPDRDRCIIGSLEDRRRPVAEAHHARDGALQRRGTQGKSTRVSRRLWPLIHRYTHMLYWNGFPGLIN